MPFPVPFLIFLQFLLNEASASEPLLRFLSPVDGLSPAAIGCYAPRDRGAIRLVFYMKPGDRWQGAGDRDGVRWSGYRTLDGGTFRYAQARAFVQTLAQMEERETAELSWTDAGIVDNIPTCVPGSCLPDSLPVMEVSRWLGEAPHITLRYVPPMADFSPSAVLDRDPLAPGREGDFGAVVIDPSGFKRLQRGVDIAGRAGETPVAAAALGRVVLVSRVGDAKASALGPDGVAVARNFPPNRPDKGATLKEYGNCVYVSHPDGYGLRYAHLASIAVEAGQGVLPGTAIGTTGGEGPDAAPGSPGWVHIEVRWGDPLSDADSMPVNPWEFFKMKGASSPGAGS